MKRLRQLTTAEYLRRVDAGVFGEHEPLELIEGVLCQMGLHTEGELDPEATIRKFRIVQTEGTREVTGVDYFDELLERIRDIRASERRFYQKITGIYAQCSVDYDPYSDLTQTFYATVQNKLHWAIHGRTAADLIHERADASTTAARNSAEA